MVADKKTTPVPRSGPATPSSGDDISSFLAKARAGTPPVRAGEGRGRLIFALDATMSRQPTWDAAMKLQADMFDEAARLGSLDVQLVYFRGLGECRASRWVNDPGRLRTLMTGIDCRGGQTQIGRVLKHARKETGKTPVGVLVLVGDALEELIDDLAAVAGELGMLGVRVFVFQEGRDPRAEPGFREIARLSGGAYARFDPNAPRQLAELLRAAAAYAVGGAPALARSAAAGALLIGPAK
jgi:hypothetical protein